MSVADLKCENEDFGSAIPFWVMKIVLLNNMLNYNMPSCLKQFKYSSAAYIYQLLRILSER